MRPASRSAASATLESAVPLPVTPAAELAAISRLRPRETWALLKPYWVSSASKGGWGLLAVIVALSLGLVYLNVVFTDWNRLFYNALEQRDFAEFRTQLWRFCWIAAAIIIASIFKLYYTMMLQMRWRTWMTEQFLDRWMTHQAFYRIEQTRATDNPDQRIADDLRVFTDSALSLALGLLSSVVTLLSFVGLLWVVSGPVSFALFGSEIIIPGYMVWFAVAYAVIGSLIMHFVGRPLIGLNFQQERYEADFRFMLVRLRENAEPVALYRGEPVEQAALTGRFGRIRANWAQLMDYTRRLTFVRSGYGQFAIIFPILVAAPRYFGGQMTLGGLMQVSSAFGQVQGALSWFVDSYGELVGWKAAANRLIEFRHAMESAEHDAAQRDGVHQIAVRPAAAPAIAAHSLVLNVPGRPADRALTEPFDLRIAPGERWFVSGPSGCGKSVLFRAMAGIWPYGAGEITVPDTTRPMFLPQRSYLPVGTLADVLCYPDGAAAHPRAHLEEVLTVCRLTHLTEVLDSFDNWSLRLSPGEQQRIAFARAVLQQPDYLFLDEATSALDEETEAAMYALVLERLPGVALVSIAHRSTVARFHTHRLLYRPVTPTGMAGKTGQGEVGAVSYRVQASVIAANPGHEGPADAAAPAQES